MEWWGWCLMGLGALSGAFALACGAGRFLKWCDRLSRDDDDFDVICPHCGEPVEAPKK